MNTRANAIATLAAAVADYETAWRRSTEPGQSSELRIQHTNAMQDASRRQESAMRLLSEMIGTDITREIRAALIGATVSVEGERPARHRADYDAYETCKRIVIRNHEYF